MIVDNPDRSWEQYGKNDPYFGVLADEGLAPGGTLSL